MVIDTSALIAIMLQEPEADRLVAALETDGTRLISAASVVEATLVILGRFGDTGEPQLDRFLRAIGAEVVPVDSEQVSLARDAALRFGRGRHGAGLNFGDCFSYALSVAHGEPLLYVGEDFARTDVETVRW
ncbi:MAG: type II toxin-antitoxin system VapC family toxin [Gemmatimonadales bacterium]|nr:type II toxin-antitoxin system VapC family toxin [Gemmatimonadales bacterium]